VQSNFTYLQTEWPSIFSKVQKAEQSVCTEPITSGFYARLALEEVVKIIYSKNYIALPYNSTIFSLLTQPDFVELVPAHYLSGVDKYTRVIGNNASHGKQVNKDEALTSLKYLFTFLKWFALQYSLQEPAVPGSFDETFIPKVGEEKRKLKELQAEIERLQLQAEAAEKIRLKEVEHFQEEIKENAATFEAYQAEKEIKLRTLADNSQQRDFSQIVPEYTEAQTRIHIIDAALKEAGWDNLRAGHELEFPVTGMPVTADNPNANGFVDYVLWDDSGLPLAVIEAKRTSRDATQGRHQAFLYANCLEEMRGQRPFIFYTNGYETFLWDDSFYVPRQVHAFYSKEELQWLLQKRNSRKDIRSFVVNKEIAGRVYQEEAIKRVAETFARTSPITKSVTGGRTSALLVMATGSGKTRTAAALTELLFNARWIKRVLFLADRNALVRQAKKNFNEYLPEYTSIDLTKEKESDSTRLVFSTYPSMMNRIDSAKANGKRLYGIGHFDLIIVDEAHRSVYNKYGAIFEYFDALIVGLTATPKTEIDHHTYNLFGCAADDPTFAYELDKAVEDGFLVEPKRFDLTTRFLREGVKYNELSEKDKEHFEETFDEGNTEVFPEEIENSALTKWLFNKDTVAKVLNALIKNGIQIEGGDKLGRTIIFAANQKHADFIVKCFHELYPQYPGNYIDLVYNGISHVQSIIDKFCDKDKEFNPQIVVSVDMMDTGIDAVRVLNLVFFKMVRSYSKFWQMIGRGTRLCPNIFGEGDHKKEFYIFDTCGNFEFFEVNPTGADSGSQKPLSQQLFESRIQLSQLLVQTGENENLELASNLFDLLCKAIASLDRYRFEVTMNLRYVDEFKVRERWNNLSNDDILDIQTHISGLPVPDLVHETARRFDLLVVKMQIANLLALTREAGYAEQLKDTAEQLTTKYTIPEVLKRRELIENMRTEAFYSGISQGTLEQVRVEIRDLLILLDSKERKVFYTDLEDMDLMLEPGEIMITTSRETYRARVERFIRENKNHLTINKLNTNLPITQAEINELERILFDGDERGTKADFVNNIGDEPLGKFIRSIVGLETSAAQEAFSEFLAAGNLSADQITFLDTIISYLTKNGTIDKAMLVNAPFTDRHDQGIFGIFEEDAQGKIISIIDQINGNAERVS
jgi:type I restriction enzyme R subunit